MVIKRLMVRRGDLSGDLPHHVSCHRQFIELPRGFNGTRPVPHPQLPREGTNHS